MRMIAISTWLTQVASFPSKNHLQSIVVIITISSIVILILIVILKTNIIMNVALAWCGPLLEGRVCACRRDAPGFANSDEDHDQEANDTDNT